MACSTAQAVLLLAALAAPSALQEPSISKSASLAGGKSPDGRYDIRIVETSGEPSNYGYAVVDAKSGRRIKFLGNAGGAYRYDDLAGSMRVAWHAGSAFFAITDRGTRHSQEVYVYEIKPNDVMLISIPDYLQNALGRVGATDHSDTVVTEPRRWDGDRLICDLAFGTAPNGSGTYSVQFALRVWYGQNVATRLTLDSMSMPRRR